MENQGAGRREFERFPVEFKVEVHALEGVIRHYLEDACLRDVSGGGACFSSVCPDMYSIGQRLLLTIHLPGTDKMNATMEGEAIVAWIGEQEGVASNKPAGSRIGVMMDDLMAFNSVLSDQTGGVAE